ncbi:galactitol-1-phosphate 5-dehydrogenase [Candidatus Dependentiae bacterium]
MKALVLEDNKKLVYKNVADPIVGDDECLIVVKSAGICSSDFHRAYNNWAYFYPLIMGHEFAGEVIKTGRLVTKYSLGDRVVIFPLLPCNKCEFCLSKQHAQCISYNYYGSRRDGGFAEYVSVKEWNLLKLPKEISFQRAAVIEPIAVAIHAISRAKIKPEEKIAILGTGFIGLVTAFLLSKKVDPKLIYMIDQDKNKLEFAAKYGFKTICTKDNEFWEESIVKAGGMHTVFEMCGVVQTFKHSLIIAKSHGQIIWVGNITSDIMFEKKLISSILRKELSIKGSWNSLFVHNNNDDWHKAICYAKQASELEEMITHVISLEQGVIFFESRMLHPKKENNLYIKSVFKM